MRINYSKMPATAENRSSDSVSLAFLQPGRHAQQE